MVFWGEGHLDFNRKEHLGTHCCCRCGYQEFSGCCVLTELKQRQNPTAPMTATAGGICSSNHPIFSITPTADRPGTRA
ncbi:MAG: hypothetical protein AAGA66_06535, partial [Bacteroidota bacterium]